MFCKSGTFCFAAYNFSGKTKLRDVGGGSHSEKREWEVGQKGSYDDIDDGNSMKKITLY